MALVTTGLTDSGSGAGTTTNFQVQYESTLPNQGPRLANANALISVLETEFTVTTGWFNTPSGKFGASHRQVVNLNKASGSGANNSGYGSAINLDAQDANTNAADAAERVKMVWMNEWVEILMSLSGGKWNAGDSSGEGLSQYCGIIRFQGGHYSYYNSWVDQWLNTQPRQDWVNSTESTDGNVVSFGCALGIHLLPEHTAWFSINQILAAGSSNLAKVYRTLTGDNGDPFPFFASLLERVFPSSATAAIPGPVSDNPYPIAALSFWADKNTFGKDEVQDIITTSSGRWPRSFWLVVDGFSKNSFAALGIAAPAPTGPFSTIPGVTLTQRPDIDFENAANPQSPQRIRIPFDITFSSAALGQFPSIGSTTSELDGALTSAGTAVPGATAAILFELLAGADPYFTNIDPSQNNVFYLSQDLRVFTATPDHNSTPVAGGPAFPSNDVGGAYGYVQQLLGWLNSTYSDPSGTDPFTTVLPGQSGALQGDSSVTPISVDFSNFPPKIEKNFNFAVARVRLRGTAGPAGMAKDVRVFFRLWSTQTADTDYQPASTYLSVADPAGQPGSPLAGAGHTTLPFFATGNSGAAADYAVGGPNIQNVQISTGDSVWFYYGCFLNLYDPGNIIDGKPVQQWLNGTHHCLVAQIAFDDAPLFTGESPQSSDKLAQRNLQLTASDNPGPAATHRVPQTFDIRPSTPVGQGAMLRPDELMIDWGDIPKGSTATIFWPQVQASEVISLANSLYASHTLSASETSVVKCQITGGVTYVPIPASSGENFAGLLTVDLPQGIVTGQEFTVVVRRVATRDFPSEIDLRSLPSTADKQARPKPRVKRGGDGPVERYTSPSWRYVVGTFQVTIPVSTREAMLFPEENTLAIMKWRLANLPFGDRWYPVIERLVRYMSDRVDGLGGDSGSIEPSPNGVPVKVPRPPHQREFTGKVCEILYDCFGDFEGFVLDCCDVHHSFSSRRSGIAEVALRACRHDLRLTVIVDHDGDHIQRLALNCC